MFFTVAGTSSVTTAMIKETVVPRIIKAKKVVTDCKSSYEEVAKENNWNLKQIKSGTYTDNENNNLANINSLHQQLTIYLSNFRGVSTKHLQEYLNLFCFLKYLNWTTDYSNQLCKFINTICVKIQTSIILTFVIIIVFLISLKYIRITTFIPQKLQHSVFF